MRSTANQTDGSQMGVRSLSIWDSQKAKSKPAEEGFFEIYHSSLTNYSASCKKKRYIKPNEISSRQLCRCRKNERHEACRGYNILKKKHNLQTPYRELLTTNFIGIRKTHIHENHVQICTKVVTVCTDQRLLCMNRIQLLRGSKPYVLRASP